MIIIARPSGHLVNDFPIKHPIDKPPGWWRLYLISRPSGPTSTGGGDRGAWWSQSPGMWGLRPKANPKDQRAEGKVQAILTGS